MIFTYSLKVLVECSSVSASLISEVREVKGAVLPYFLWGVFVYVHSWGDRDARRERIRAAR